MREPERYKRGMKGQSFVIKGHPVPQPRPRVTTLKLGDVTRGQAYVPKKHAIHEWRNTCAAEFTQHGHVYEGPLDVTLVFHLPRPKSHYGTGRNEHRVKDSAPTHPTVGKYVGDVDNLAKAVLDAAQGILFDDDKQVCSLHVLKQWAPKGAAGVYVQVREVPVAASSAT